MLIIMLLKLDIRLSRKIRSLLLILIMRRLRRGKGWSIIEMIVDLNPSLSLSLMIVLRIGLKAGTIRLSSKVIWVLPRVSIKSIE